MDLVREFIALLAQLDRALAYEARGYRFKSCTAQIKIFFLFIWLFAGLVMRYPLKEKIETRYMRSALSEAIKALKKNEVPVGAIIVSGDKIISRAHNQPISSNDPTAHAEIIALRKAAHQLKNYRLNGCEIYVTKEPCVMCAGALVHARIKKINFGCYDKKSGACGSVFNVAHNKKLNHRVEIAGGILEKDCRELIQNFFKSKR